MNQLEDFVVPREEVSQLLAALGIHLDTTLAPAFVLVATDLLVASELARTLPHGADFMGAVTQLESFVQELPEPVLLTAQKVYQQLLVAADEPENQGFGCLAVICKSEFYSLQLESPLCGLSLLVIALLLIHFVNILCLKLKGCGMVQRYFLDTQFGGASGHTPISIGVVRGDGQLVYVEATDVLIAPVETLSKFQKTVGARFVTTNQVTAEALEWMQWIEGQCDKGEGVHLVCSNEQVRKLWAGQAHNLKSKKRVKVSVGRPSEEVKSKVFELCGGAANSHALMEALAMAAADLDGGLVEALDTTRYGLLIGLKNSLSLRAYLRRLVEGRVAGQALSEI